MKPEVGWRRLPLHLLLLLLLLGAKQSCWAAQTRAHGDANLTTQSGLRMWVDPETPPDQYTWQSSRGDTWELVMSDEFNTPGRSFRPGDDHLWTSIEKPDGVNDALEVYAHNKTTTVCDGDSGVCSFQIELEDAVIHRRIWNGYLETPGFHNVTFFYRGGMVQSWNKFCMQGGMVEVRVQLPGAVSEASGNPDVVAGSSARAESLRYYPTWPGIWMMGNLGRAIFSGSTDRIWPFSYDECDPDTFVSSNQRISACDASPGSGLNPHQGRGAPEIDIIEGGGSLVSSSIQVGPGMPLDFRVVTPKNESKLCIYSTSCQTPGANVPGIPESVYLARRGHESWYQKLRYAANNLCQRDETLVQSYATVKHALDAGVEDNVCSLTTCPASHDIHSDLDVMDSDGEDRWGINSNGSCFSVMNSYMGVFICSPGNPDPRCEDTEDAPRIPPPASNASTFAYQMDALSANWPVHVGAYTDFMKYQLEWVPGPEGYVRWMLEGQPLYEIPAQALTDPPQWSKASDQTNPHKIMIEEPMYLLFNVAVSSKWGAQPPNPKHPCRGDGMDPVANRICDALPMYLKVDYIRVYQDVASRSTMSVGCDPKTHPTRQWIRDHLEDYEDEDNKLVEVRGKAFCRQHTDCTVQTRHRPRGNAVAGSGGGRKDKRPVVLTGRCVNQRCECVSGAWAGPRCIIPSQLGERGAVVFGPPLLLAIGTSLLLLGVAFASCYAMRAARKKHVEAMAAQRKLQQQHQQYELLRRVSSRHLQSAWSSE